MTGFSGQQVKDMPIDGERDGNLFEPVQHDAATHGIFDEQAKSRSPQLWAATHRPLLGGAIAVAALAGVRQRRRRAPEPMTLAGDGESAVASMRRTSCASTRCWPTASAASSSARAETSSGCAFPDWDSGGSLLLADRRLRRLRDHPAPNDTSGAATTSRGA